MKKKVIGLSILLLVLLLGLSTICYADELGSSFVEQVITLSNSTNAVTNNGYISVIYSTFNNNRSYFSPAETYFTQYDYFIVESLNQYDSSAGLEYYTRNMVLYFFNASDDVNFRIVNSSLSSNSSVDYRVIRFRNGSISSNTITSSNSLSLHFYQLVSNYDKEIKNDDGTVNSLINTAFNEGFVASTYFEFEMNEYTSTQYVNIMFNGTTYNNVPVYYKPADTTQIFIGTLLNTAPVTLKEDFFGLVYWNGSSWVTRDIQERDLNTFVYSSPFLSIQSNSDMTEYTYGQQPRFAAKDCFYFYSIDDVDYNRAYALWYIGSSHTIISGDKIDPSTFNDYPDYDDNVKSVFNNIDDIDNIAAATEPILQALTDDEQVSGELAGLISGDADDIVNRFGYSPIENPFVAVVVDITESLTDILLGSGDVSLNFGFGGRDYYVSSSKFVFPYNSLTSFIHLCCNAFVLWQLWKYGFKLYEWVNSGRLQNLVNETNGHQYFLF